MDELSQTNNAMHPVLYIKSLKPGRHHLYAGGTVGDK